MSTEHWAAAWLARLDELNLELERWPDRPFEANGRPVKVFLDGRLTVRLRADADGSTIEFLTDPTPMVPGCERKGSIWQASFDGDAVPGESMQQSWHSVLTRMGRAKKAAEEAVVEEDDAYYWVWDARARLTDRALYDFDRRPFSEQLRQAFGQLTDDEQALLRAQWKREAQEEGPTVAEALGWSGKQVMDVYRSAMAKMKAAATGYKRPKRKRR